MYNVFNGNSLNTQTLPYKSNLINYSAFNELLSPIHFRSFSIKYVIEGCEKYTVNGNPYFVNQGEYLLANHFSEGFVEIDSHHLVKGICIDVSPRLISEVISSYISPEIPAEDIPEDDFFNSPHFLENQYSSTFTKTGNLLRSLDQVLSKNPYGQHEFSSEFYLKLAENIVQDHIPIYKQLQQIPAIKSETKKVLLRKLNQALDYINQHFTHPLVISTVASECCLSEFHFYRMFRLVFDMSPQQYIISKKLNYALELIKLQGADISEAALLSGFSDISAFSKTFKKHYGCSPSKFQK